MRHGYKKPHLNRTASHRRALYANMACALIKERQIRTTLAKAKALRPYVERMITFAKKGDLASRRHVLSLLGQKDAVKELFLNLAPHYAERNGGYTRILKLGFRRGDAAPTAIMELVDREALPGESEKVKKEQEKRSAKKKSADKAAPEKKSKGKAKKKTKADAKAEAAGESR
jgi:large subunit ribosomal protein L17